MIDRNEPPCWRDSSAISDVPRQAAARSAMASKAGQSSAVAARQAAANSAPSTAPVPRSSTLSSQATSEARSLMKPSSTAVSTPWL